MTSTATARQRGDDVDEGRGQAQPVQPLVEPTVFHEDSNLSINSMGIDNRYARRCQPSISPIRAASQHERSGLRPRARSPVIGSRPSSTIPTGDGHEGSDGRRPQRRIAKRARHRSKNSPRVRYHRSAAPAPTSAHMPQGRLAVSRGAIVPPSNQCGVQKTSRPQLLHTATSAPSNRGWPGPVRPALPPLSNVAGGHSVVGSDAAACDELQSWRLSVDQRRGSLSYRITISDSPLARPTARRPGTPSTTRTGRDDAPTQSRRRAASPATSTHAK